MVHVDSPLGVISLFERGGWWHARRRFGKKEVHVGLRTRDREEAVGRAYPLMLAKTGRHEEAEKAVPDAVLRSALKSASSNARSKGVEFALDFEWLKAVATANGNRCALTGLPFSMTRHGWSRSPFSPSIDRIIPAKGYVKTNVRLVCTAVNWAMSDWGQDVFDMVCSSRVKQLSTFAS